MRSWFAALPFAPSTPAPTDKIGLEAAIALIRAGTWPRIVFSALCALIAIPYASSLLLAAWVTFFVVWELAVRPALEDRFARPAGARSEEAGFSALAAMNFVGSVGYCVFPPLVWSSGELVGMMLAVGWVCGAAAHDFVYFAARRVLVLSWLVPLLAVSLAAPFSQSMSLSPLSLIGAVVLLGVVAIGGLAGYDRRELSRALAASAAARQAAEEASAAKSRFLGLVSHELRTPLNAIIGYAEIIAEAEDQHADDAKRVLGAANRLLDLVNGMLEVSKLEAGLATPMRTLRAGKELVDELAAHGAPLAAARSNRFIVRADGELGAANIDWARLRRAAMRLIENAAQFTQNGEIEVIVSRRRASAEAIVVDVRDTGPGIAPEQLAHLFDPLTPEAAGDRRHDGAGLGLAEARLTARLLGGDIACESAPGRGAAFTLWVAI